MRLVSKIEYLIVPKWTKFTGSGKFIGLIRVSKHEKPPDWALVSPKPKFEFPLCHHLLINVWYSGSNTVQPPHTLRERISLIVWYLFPNLWVVTFTKGGWGCHPHPHIGQSVGRICDLFGGIKRNLEVKNCRIDTFSWGIHVKKEATDLKPARHKIWFT